MYCSNCGKQIPDEAAFCPTCGSPQRKVDARQKPEQKPAKKTAQAQPQYEPQSPRIGYSDIINDPEFIAGAKKMNRSIVGCAIGMIPLPLIGFSIYGLVSEEMKFAEALKTGLGVSAIFLVFYIIFLILNFRDNKQWDGIVEDKEHKTYEKYDKNSHTTRYDSFDTVIIRKDNGKKVKVTESSPGRYYDYFEIGDRLRHHPGLNFCYEKYDKSRDKIIYCAICGHREKIQKERCERCNNLLLK